MRMKPQLAQFESKNLITVVNIDLEKKSTPEYKKYMKLMDSRGIPYTIIIGPDGKVVSKMVGGRSSEELAKETRKVVK